jgi:hypothetical protein
MSNTIPGVSGIEVVGALFLDRRSKPRLFADIAWKLAELDQARIDDPTLDVPSVTSKVWDLISSVCLVHGELPNWPECVVLEMLIPIAGRRDFLILFVYVIVTVARLAKPGGLRSVAESALVRHQLLVLNRGASVQPNPPPPIGSWPVCVPLSCAPYAFSVQPTFGSLPLCCICTMCRGKRKYRMLFSPERGRRPGPKC